MPTQFLAPQCYHCHAGIMKMIRSTLVVKEDRVIAKYECMNPLCNYIVRMELYNERKEQTLQQWQYDLNSEITAIPLRDGDML